MTQGYCILQPSVVSVVVWCYLISVWSLLLTFHGFGPEFLSFGKGRSPTLLDTPEGQKIFALQQLDCEIALVQGLPLAECQVLLPQLRAQLLAQPTSPLLKVGSIIVDTDAKWAMFAIIAFLNYAFHYWGMNTIQNWIVTQLQDANRKDVRDDMTQSVFMRISWILLDFTIVVFFIFVGPAQVDFLIMSVLGYLVVSVYLTYAGMANKRPYYALTEVAVI